MSDSAPARTPPSPSNAVGEVLRHWRKVRRMSQMDTALAARVSTRHLSYVENGRSAPSVDLLSRLSDALDMPLRERNTLYAAAGYTYAQDYGGVAASDDLLRTLSAVVNAADPFPAIVFDGLWNLVCHNDAAAIFFDGVAPHLLEPPVSVARVIFDPEGLGSRLRPPASLRARLLERIERQARSRGDRRLDTLVRELREHHARASRADADADAGRHGDLHPEGAIEFAETFSVDLAGTVLTFMSTIATFGAPREVVTSELAIETFYPADASTREWLERPR